MADQPATPNQGPFASQAPYLHDYSNAKMGTPFKLDEGFSEDTRSQSEVDTAMRSEPQLSEPAEETTSRAPLPDWILRLPEHDRSGTPRLCSPRLPDANSSQKSPSRSCARCALHP